MGLTIDQELAEISDLALKIKANYLARLKTEKISMLEELQAEFEKYEPKWVENEDHAVASCRTWEDFDGIIQEKINALQCLD